MMQLLENLISAITVPIRQLYYWLTKCLPGMNFLGRLSLPTKWALLSLLFLLIAWTAAVLSHLWNEDRQEFNWVVYFALPSPFLILIPTLVYFFVRYYMMEEVSRYPDIDRVWYEGLEQAASNGLNVRRTPIFLVLGTNDLRTNRNIVGAMDIEIPVNAPASGDPPISFHASDSSVFVFLNDCSCVSRLGKSRPLAALSAAQPAAVSQSTDNEGTLDGSFLHAQMPSAPPPPHQYSPGATLQGGEYASAAAPQYEPAGGTILLDDILQDTAAIMQLQGGSRELSSTDVAECQDRLSHVCKLIRKTRGPLIPINGLLTTLQIDLVESSAKSLQVAVTKDLQTIRSRLQVRVPNTALVIGLERDEGFLEMVSRLPPQRVRENRFGKGAELWFSPTAERVGAIATYAITAFEDQIYNLFQAEGALKRKRNSRLYLLLCRIRGVFGENLKSVLTGGFGFDSHAHPELAYRQMLFGGCYFAGAGVGESERAFLKNVLVKLMQQDGEIEWSEEAREADRQTHFFANLAAFVGLLALLAIAGMFAYRYLR